METSKKYPIPHVPHLVESFPHRVFVYSSVGSSVHNINVQNERNGFRFLVRFDDRLLNDRNSVNFLDWDNYYCLKLPECLGQPFTLGQNRWCFQKAINVPAD